MSKEKSLLQRFSDGEELTIDEHAQLQKHLAELRSSPVLPMPDNSRPSVEDTRFYPVVAKQDNEGHWYVIPADKAEDFYDLLEKSTSSRSSTEESEKAETEFIEKYSDYRTGGDLNLTQLYMKVEEKPAIELKEGKVFVFGDAAPIQRGPDIDEHGIAGPASGKCPPLNSVEHEYHATFTLKQPGALEMVEEFHKAFNCPVYTSPVIPDVPFGYALSMDWIEHIKKEFKNCTDTSRAFLRIKLVFEEFTEMAEAISTHDIVKILDALCDLLYVVYGTAHEFGLGPVLKEAFREVHRSNMSKLNGDGTPIVRNDGKVLKGPNFTPPDLAGVINRYQNNQQEIEKWREAADKAIKEGPKSDAYKGNDLLHYVGENMPMPSLGANMPEIPGMPEPTNDGVIYSDLKVGEVTQSDDGSINVEIHGTKHTPVESVKATILFAPGSPELEAAKSVDSCNCKTCKCEKQAAITTDDIELVLTCHACPEQYDAFYQGKQVGYLRLRHGHFTVDYLKCGGEEIFSACPDGDGIFENKERGIYLTAAKTAIIERMMKDPSGPWAMGSGH